MTLFILFKDFLTTIGGTQRLFSDLNFVSDGRGVRDFHECIQSLTDLKHSLK